MHCAKKRMVQASCCTPPPAPPVPPPGTQGKCNLFARNGSLMAATVGHCEHCHAACEAIGCYELAWDNTGDMAAVLAGSGHQTYKATCVPSMVSSVSGGEGAVCSSLVACHLGLGLL